MNLRRKLTLTATALAAATALGLPSGSVQAAAPKTAAPQATGCTPTWKTVETPLFPATFGNLQTASITGLSRSDTWITASDGSGTTPITVLRWDGHSFNPAASPAVPPLGGQGGLDVGQTSFGSDTEGWGLATYVGRFRADGDVAEHWHDGHWAMTPLAVPPDPANTAIQQEATAVLSATDAWNVGALYLGGVPKGPPTAIGAMIEHWDGTEWSIVPNPASDQASALLHAIDARSATDIWAVGSQRIGGSSDGVPLIEHFDGTAWKVIPDPAVVGPSALTSVHVTSPTDAWATGTQTLSGTHTAAPLVEHFDGTAWNVVTGLPDTDGDNITAVTGSGPDDVWALMHRTHDPGTPVFGSINVVLHFDGTSWTRTTLPGPTGFNARTVYRALTGTAPDDVWAVGEGWFGNSTPRASLLAHLSCGKD